MAPSKTSALILNPRDGVYGAKGDGSHDDTAALTAWINDINDESSGVLALLPGGQYMISSPLPAITNNGVRLYGANYAQTNYTFGSVISAAVGLTGTMLTLGGEGIALEGITVDGGGRASTLLALTGSQCHLTRVQTRGVAANGVCVDIQTGAFSTWLQNCRISGINYPNTGVQVNDTDLIMLGCKPVNNTYNVLLLGGASGAILNDNHLTPSANGQNCVWINGNPSHVTISGNRFDNYTFSAVQITPPSSTPNDIRIVNNDFHSTVMTDNTYPLIGLDTTASGVRGLQINNNSGYASGTHRPTFALAATTQAGAAATNPTRVATLGTQFNGNCFWAATGSFGASASPTVARGNMLTTDGTTYAAVADI